MSEASTIREQLTERRERLQQYLGKERATDQLLGLLREVDSALERLELGTYGICEVCREEIEPDYLRADPLVRICLEHLNQQEQHAIERDLELAARVQGRLLPSCNVSMNGWELCHHYEPHGVVGGDYCDFIPPTAEDEHLHFFVGDVSGKGVSASLLVFHLHAMFRSMISSGLSLKDMVERANRLFCESTLSSQFATLVCGRATPGGDIEICNAGHCSPFAVQDGRIRGIERTGFPLGISYGGRYETRHVQFSRGDLLFLYTDGLVETFNERNEEYSDARLSALVAAQSGRSPEALLRTCVEDLAAFRMTAPRRDDLTIMALKRSP